MRRLWQSTAILTRRDWRFHVENHEGAAGYSAVRLGAYTRTRDPCRVVETATIDHGSCQVRQTPLYHEHQSLGAKVVDFHGWALPVQYSGILDEHEHTRRHAAIFDCSHMAEFLLRGRAAIEHFDRLVCANVWSLAVGRCRYGAILNDRAGIIDDTIMLRLGEDEYYVVTNAGPREQVSPLLCDGVEGASDVSDETAKIDVQGPLSRDVLLRLGLHAIVPLKYYQGTRATWMGGDIVVTRAGYTGELGYELFLPNAIATRVWQELIAQPEVRPAGLGARNTLRLELGYPLSGEDFTEANTPLESGMARFIEWDKGFAGKEALARQREQGGHAVLGGIRTRDRRKPQHAFELYLDSAPAGIVTSGTYGPSLGYGIGLAMLQPQAAAPGVALTMGPRAQDVDVVSIPFYTEGTCRKA